MFHFLDSVLGQATRPRARPNGTRLAVEGLEQRSLPSASSTGHLIPVDPPMHLLQAAMLEGQLDKVQHDVGKDRRAIHHDAVDLKADKERQADLLAKLDKVAKDIAADVKTDAPGLKADLARAADLQGKLDHVEKDIAADKTDLASDQKSLKADRLAAADLEAQLDKLLTELAGERKDLANDIARLKADRAKEAVLETQLDKVMTDLAADWAKGGSAWHNDVTQAHHLVHQLKQVRKDIAADKHDLFGDLIAGAATHV